MILTALIPSTREAGLEISWGSAPLRLQSCCSQPGSAPRTFLAGVNAWAGYRVSVTHRNDIKRNNKNRAFKLHEITSSVPEQ